MKKQLLLIAALCSLGLAHGQTAILKLLKEYQSASPARKAKIAEDVQRKYGKLAEQFRRKILPKIKKSGIEVEVPRQILELIKEYRTAVSAGRKGRIEGEIDDLLNELSKETKARLRKHIEDAKIDLDIIEG